MGNIGKGATMDNSGHILQSLYQIRLNSILQKRCHRTVSLDLTSGYRVAAIVISHDNLAQAFL